MAKAPPLVVPNAGMCRLLFQIGTNGVMVNVLGMLVNSGTTFNQALANSLGANIKSNWTTNLQSHVASSVTLQQVGVRDLRSPNLPEFLDAGAGVAGTAVGDQLPGSVALVITLRTNLAGHRYRGRVYLGGFSEADNIASGSAATALSSAGVAFVTAISSSMSNNGLGLAVLSRPSYAQNFVKSYTDSAGTVFTETHTRQARPGAVTPVTGIIARNAIWDSQRRRTAAGSASTRAWQPVAAEYLE